MSNTSSDLLLSLSEFNSSSCNRSKRNETSKTEVTSKSNVLIKTNTSENYNVKSQSLSEDRSENYARLLKESEQALANRNVLVSLLQDQLVKMEELYKSTLGKQTLANKTYPVYTKNPKGAQAIKLSRSEDDEGKFTTEDELGVKNLSQSIDAQPFEESHKLEESRTSNTELSTNVADSRDLSLVDSLRSHHTIKSVRSKIQTEFFHEFQVNFEGLDNPSHANKELLYVKKKVDSRHHLENSSSQRQRDEMEAFFEQASKDEIVLKRALHSQKDMIEDLQRNLTAITEKQTEFSGRHKNLFKGKDQEGASYQTFSSDFSSLEESSLYESPKHKRMIAESELRKLNEQLFQKDQFINVQQKKMRRLRYKLKCAYLELMRHAIKNKKQSDCESKRLDAVKGDYKDVLCLEELTKDSELKIQEECKEDTKTIGDLQNQSSLAEIEIDYKCAREKILYLEEFEEFKNGESAQNLTIEEVESQDSTTINRMQDLDALQTKITQMTSELEKVNKKIMKCVDQNRRLFEDYEVKLEHVQNQLRLAKEENEKLDATIHQKNEQLKQLEKELIKEKEATIKYKEISKSLNESQETHAQKDRLVAELRENLNQILNEARHSREVFEGKLQEKGKRIGILDQNFKQITKELDNTNKEREQFIQEVQKLFCEYEVKLAVVKDEGDKAQRKILQLKRNENALNLQLTMTQAEAEKLKRDYDALNLDKQTMKEELENIIECKEKELNQRSATEDERVYENRRLEEEVKSLRVTLSQQKKQLEISNENRANLVNETKKLEGEVKAKAELLKQSEYNFQIKSAVLVKQLEETERQREEYIEKNKILFCKHEDEMRQLSNEREKMNEAVRLKKEEAELLGNEVKELRTRVVCLERDKENLQGQIIYYEGQLENQCEEYERKVMLMNEERGSQKEEEINSLRVKISELEVKLQAAETVQQVSKNHKRKEVNKTSEASLSQKSSNCSIFEIIKEDSALEAYEEIVMEKENLEVKLKEMEKALEYERKSKTEVEIELFRFRENERAVNENLTKILPEFLGQGDKLEGALDENRLKKNAIGDLRDELNLLSKELERTKEEKSELIRNGKQIFHYYETRIIKLKSDYENLFWKQSDPKDLRHINKEKEENLECKLIKEEARKLRESQEAYSKKLTCCLKELAVYKDEVKNWMEIYDKVVKEKLDLEMENKILVNNVLHKDEIIKEMQNKLYNAQEKFENATKENEEKEKIICDYGTKCDQLSSAYEDVQNKLEQLKKSKDKINKKIITKDKVIRQYEEQMDFERKENARLNEDIVNLKTKLSTLQEDIEEKEKEFYVQLDQTRSALSDATQNYEKLEMEYNCLAEKQDVEFYKIENLNLIHKVEKRDEKIKSLMGDIEELKKELRSVRTEIDLNNARASLNWEELQLANAELEKNLELTKCALKKQECQALIKADDDFKDLHRQIDVLRDDNNFLKEKLACKNEEIVRLSEALERAQKEKTELDLHMANTVRTLEGEIHEIKSNNRMLHEQITDKRDKENECETLKQQLEEANTQRANLEADTKRLRETLQGVEDRCVSLKSKNKKLQDDLSVMEKELHVNKEWKTENTKLQEILDKIEGELFAMKHQCVEVHEQLETTKTELAETQEELSSAKRDLESAKSSMSGETTNEIRCCYKFDKTPKESLLTSKANIDEDSRSICMKVNLEKTNVHSSDTIQPNEHISVLYNNTKFNESRCETESTISNIIFTRKNKLQQRLASLNQMEKEVEEMIAAVQQQNKKLRECHLARVKTEKNINTRLQKVRQRSEILAINFNTFQLEKLTSNQSSDPNS